MAPITGTGSSRSQREIPFAGHPSLGTAVAVARWRGLTGASFVQETRAGLQPIEVRSEDGRWRAEMLQNAAEFGTKLDPEAVMHAVGLNSAEAHQDLPPQIVSTGLPTAIVPVSDAGLAGADRPGLRGDRCVAPDAQPRAGETPNFYLVWVDEQAERRGPACSRRVVSGGEDPATGSAAGPLGAYLSPAPGRERVVISQGEEMGRPSVLEVEMVEGRPRVGGG